MSRLAKTLCFTGALYLGTGCSDGDGATTEQSSSTSGIAMTSSSDTSGSTGDEESLEESTSEGSGGADTSTSTTGGSEEGSSGSSGMLEPQCVVPWTHTRCENPGPSAYAGCDVYNQDCPEGQRCVPLIDAEGAFGFTCVARAARPAGLDEPCTATNGTYSGGDSCDAGLYCLVTIQNQGTCQPLCGCGPTQPTCPQGYACDDWKCEPACDPLDPDACGSSSGCYPAKAGDQQVYTCDFTQVAGQDQPGQPAARVEGEACTRQHDCVRGTMCRESVCRRYCDTEVEGSCPGGRACEMQLFSEISPECLQHVGLCALPM